MSRYLIALLLATLALAPSTRAQTLSPLSDGVEYRAGGLIERVTALRDDIVRVRVGAHGALPEDASWAVLATARTAHATVAPTATGFTTRDVVVRIDPIDGRLTIEDRSGHTVLADAPAAGLVFRGDGFALRKVAPPGERYFALGDKTGGLDHRGQAFSMWNSDAYGYESYSDPLYKSIPFVIGVAPDGRSFGLLLDNTWRSWFDLGRTEPDIFSLGAPDGPLDYYVMAEPDPKGVVKAYADLTGAAPLPPLWALGFQQSRYSYMSADEVRGIADRLRAEHIPADAIYLDIDYQDRNRPFTVNTKTFPNLPKLATDLKAQGFHLVAITDLHIADAPNQGYAPFNSGLAGDEFVKTADGKLYVGDVWPGPSVFPDFTQARTRAWWGGLYKDFLAEGIAGFWNDMNEPAVFTYPTKTMPPNVAHRIDEPGFQTRTAPHAEVHNIFGMENSRATYDGLLALAPNERPFVLTRASFAGGQRYAATWTGDNSPTWSHLTLSINMQLNLGLSGFAWVGADVGGFNGSPPPDLLTKWYEVAAFTPIFRAHAAKGAMGHEPWVDGPAQTAIRRRYIEERYRLMPYIYALADEAARTGLPLMRPIVLEFPTAKADDSAASFMLGRDLLIAPAKHGEALDAYDISLPGKGWFDYWTGRRVVAQSVAGGDANGDDVVQARPSLADLPVFVRPGAILPRQPLVQSLSQMPSGRLELRVYPGPDCFGDLYWDDGHSRGRGDADVLRQHVTCAATEKGLSVRFDPRQGRYPAWWSGLDLVIYGAGQGKADLNGAALAVTSEAGSEGLHIALPDVAQGGVVTVKY